MTCAARQYSDQMSCGRCGLCWDVNDNDPPPCRATPAPTVHEHVGVALDQRDNTVSVGRLATDLTSQQSNILAHILQAGHAGVMLETLMAATSLASTDSPTAWYRLFQDMETRLARLKISVSVTDGRVTIAALAVDGATDGAAF